MTNSEKYQLYKQVLSSCPNESVFWDGDEYYDSDFNQSYKVLKLYSSDKGTVNTEGYVWREAFSINTGKLQRLSDMEDFCKLYELLCCAKLVADNIVEVCDGQ